MKVIAAKKIIALITAAGFIFSQTIPLGYAATQPVVGGQPAAASTQPQTDALAPTPTAQAVPSPAAVQTPATTLDFLASSNTLSASRQATISQQTGVQVAAPVVTPPATQVSNNPSIVLSGTKAAGESLWISSNGGWSYTQLVAGSASTAWSASVNLVIGVNHFTIVAKDAASNQSAAVTVPTITYTVTPPTVTPPPASVSTNSITLSGTKASGESLWISSNGGRSYTQLVAGNASTAWSASVSLVKGANNFTIVAGDVDLNASAVIIVPTITCTYVAASPGVTPPATQVSNNPSIVLSGTKAAGESIWISSNAGKSYTQLVAGNASTTWSASVSLVSGANHFTIIAKDAASNQSAAVTVPTITYTVTPPGVTASATQVSNNPSIVLSGTKAAGESIWVSSNGGTSYTQLVAGNASTTWSASVGLVSGANHFTIIAEDTASNQSTAVTVPAITYTVTPPAVTPPPATVSTNSITLSGTKASGESLWISSNGGTSYTQLVAGDTSTVWSASVGLVSGTNSFTIVAEDTASNQSAAVTVPAITCTYVPTTPTPGSQVAGFMQGSTLIVTGTNGADNIEVTENASGGIVVTSSTGSLVFTGTIKEIDVYSFNGNDTIDIASSVLVPIKMYTGSGNDQLFADNTAADVLNAGSGNDLLVAISGTEDILNGGTGFDSFWCNINDVINNLSAAETNDDAVHRISQFYQPFTTNTASADYIPLTLAGQNLPDPTGSGVLVNVSADPLFNNGMVYYNDIQQGDLGDCYFLAGLASLASSEPEIVLQSIAPLGDGTFGVRFYNGSGVADYLRIDGDIFETGGTPTYAGFGSGGDTWAMLLEKAFALFREPGKNSYNSLNSGYLYEPFTALTGQSYTTLGTTSSGSGTSNTQLYNTLQTELADGEAVTLGSNATQPANSMVVGSHAYSLQSVETINGIMYATLYNPWGIVNSGEPNYNGGPNGILTITISQLQQDFAYTCASLAVVPGPVQQSAVKRSPNSKNALSSNPFRAYSRMLGWDLSGNRNTLGYPFWAYDGMSDRGLFGNEIASN